MKLGAENKVKVVLTGVLLAAGLLLVVRAFRPPASGEAATTDAAPAASAGRPAAGRAGQRQLAASLMPTLDPRLRLDLLKGSEGVAYTGAGRNIFREHLEEIPTPVAHGRTDKSPPAWTPSPPPPPPPINLKFYGFASKPGEPKAVFLSQGEDVFIAHEGEIIARRYRIVRIGPNAVEVEDVLSNNRQSIPLTQG